MNKKYEYRGPDPITNEKYSNCLYFTVYKQKLN